MANSMNVQALTEAVAEKLLATPVYLSADRQSVTGSLREVVAATVEVLVTHESHLPTR